MHSANIETLFSVEGHVRVRFLWFWKEMDLEKHWISLPLKLGSLVARYNKIN